MMASRAWLLANDLAGAGAVMITSRAMPALPAHHRVPPGPPSPFNDFAGALGSSGLFEWLLDRGPFHGTHARKGEARPRPGGDGLPPRW
jgi:hypothetical protein